MKRKERYRKEPGAKRSRWDNRQEENREGERKPVLGQTKGLGLNTPVHPLLAGLNKATKEDDKLIAKAAPKENPYLTNIEPARQNNRFQRRRPLLFNEQGKFIAQGKELREEQRKHEQQLKELEQVRSIVDFIAGEDKFKVEAPPSCEWWDEPFVVNKSYDTIPSIEELARVVERCCKQYSQEEAKQVFLSEPESEKDKPNPLTEPEPPVYLTKTEIKRKRKSERAEKHREAQDRIRLGLDPAPPPKIKPSNVMAVYANETIRDPTLMAETARKQAEERKKEHERMNEERKLTPEQHYEKEMAKIERDKATKGIYCAVFRVDCLADTKHQYQVNIMAKELHFTGVTLFNPQFSLIIVEGDAKNVLKFSRYMFNRIKWTELAPPRQESEQNGETKHRVSSFLPPPTQELLNSNRCVLVWTGPIGTSKFEKWSRLNAPTEAKAMEILTRHGAQQFWVEARVDI